MRTSLIFNPLSGTAERIKDFLLQLDSRHRCELRPTTRIEDVGRMARESVEEGFERIIVAGGDGTVSQAIQGIAPDFEAIQVAILPLGTGNDLARSLGLSPDDLKVACDAAFSSQIRSIDLIRIRTEGADEEVTYCVNAANGGFGGEVAKEMQGVDKKKWGAMAYWMKAMMHLNAMHVYRVKLQLDGRDMNRDVIGLVIANGRFVGGGFPIAPRAMLDDGRMDLTLIPEIPGLDLMTIGLNISMGRMVEDERIEMFRAAQVHLTATPEMPFSVDGEPIERFDATFEVLPGVLQMVTGPEPPALRPPERD